MEGHITSINWDSILKISIFSKLIQSQRNPNQNSQKKNSFLNWKMDSKISKEMQRLKSSWGNHEDTKLKT